MREPLPQPIRLHTAPEGPSPEIARVKDLYLRALRARVRDGSYFTEDRVRTAVDRLLKAVRDDLPGNA